MVAEPTAPEVLAFEAGRLVEVLRELADANLHAYQELEESSTEGSAVHHADSAFFAELADAEERGLCATGGRLQ